MWQSSSATDDFEPKFGLLPLIFGTTKATVFALLFGALADKIHPRKLFIGLCALICLVFAALMTGPSYAISLVLFVFCGLVGGSMMPVYGALIGRLFGVNAFGQVMGLGALVGLPVITIAPVAFGAAFDRSGGFALGLGGLVASLLASIVLFTMVSSGEARRASQPTPA